jgi:hypothetical protein
LHDRRAFGQALTVIDLQHRHIALGVDGPKIDPAFGLLFAIVDLLVFERDAGFARNDVRRERAGTGRKIQFHDKNLLGTTAWRRFYCVNATGI